MRFFRSVGGHLSTRSGVLCAGRGLGDGCRNTRDGRLGARASRAGPRGARRRSGEGSWRSSPSGRSRPEKSECDESSHRRRGDPSRGVGRGTSLSCTISGSFRCAIRSIALSEARAPREKPRSRPSRGSRLASTSRSATRSIRRGWSWCPRSSRPTSGASSWSRSSTAFFTAPSPKILCARSSPPIGRRSRSRSRTS